MHNGEVEQQSLFYFVIREITENTLHLLCNSMVQPIPKCCVSVLEAIEEKKRKNSVKGNEIIKGTEELSYEKRF